MVSISTGESSKEVSALSPALAQAKALTGTKSRTAKASSSVGKRPELKTAEVSPRAIPQELRVQAACRVSTDRAKRSRVHRSRAGSQLVIACVRSLARRLSTKFLTWKLL